MIKEDITSKRINLVPIEMTRELMMMLEKKKLIYRLCPNHDNLNAKKGEAAWKIIYENNIKNGSHMLITVTINRKNLDAFGYHEANEDFILLGDSNANPLYILIALCFKDKFEKKIKTNKLSEKDFVLLKAKYNNPELSFFVMLKNVPHGEFVLNTGGHQPSFYVTESTNMPIRIIDFMDYRIKVNNDFVK